MPQSTKPRYLLACDFDGTLFNTSKLSPNGVNVAEAYKLAFDDIFGQGTGKWILETIGLQNKAPSELISELLQSNPNSNNRRRNFFLKQAYEYFENSGKSGHLIPECKNGVLIWDYKSPETTITQMLVGRKLSHLIYEIGMYGEDEQMWPPPCQNALQFLLTVEDLKKNGYPVDLGIISSGHEAFINKTLEEWDVPYTGILVTEDDIRPKKYPREMERRFKPGQYPLALAHYKWLKQQGSSPYDGLFQQAIESKKRIMYVGDDIHKDLIMADEGRVEPYLYTKLTFLTLTNDLVRNKHLLDGRPISEILTPNHRIIEAYHGNKSQEHSVDYMGYNARK